jgi:antitoxin ParD1/3/4
MNTMNVSLPSALKAFVESQVRERGYGTTSEYVRDLIRRDQDRQQLRALLLEGGRSPAVGSADRAYFDALRHRVRGQTGE